MQKRLNRSRDEDSGGVEEPLLDVGPDPHGKGTFEGSMTVRPMWNHCIVSYATTTKRIHSRNTPTESSRPRQFTGVVHYSSLEGRHSIYEKLAIFPLQAAR